MQLAEFLQQIRQAGAGDAGKAADPQAAAVQLTLHLRFATQGVAGADHLVDIGQQMLPLLRQADAVAAAQQQRAAQLGLQLVDQVGHGGLRISQLRGRLAEASALYGGQQGAQLVVIHREPHFLRFVQKYFY